MKFACNMGFSGTVDRMAWLPSLSCDWKWPCLTKSAHSRVVGLRLADIIVLFCAAGVWNVSKWSQTIEWLPHTPRQQHQHQPPFSGLGHGGHDGCGRSFSPHLTPRWTHCLCDWQTITFGMVALVNSNFTFKPCFSGSLYLRQEDLLAGSPLVSCSSTCLTSLWMHSVTECDLWWLIE